MNTEEDLAAKTPKLELPSNEKVRELIFTAFSLYGDFFWDAFLGGIATSAHKAGRDLPSRAPLAPLAQEVIEGDRAMLHGKVDEVLDLLASRARLHEILDAALDAVIEHVGAAEIPEICSDCAAAGHGGGEG